jgi:3-hydroxyacyl-[acyl-carrier-protein] dehydratase
MRFLMVDRVLSLEPGKRIETLKLPSLSEEYLRGHFTRAAFVPGALLIETIAQSLGRLITATYDYKVAIALTVVEDARVVHDLRPGRPIHVVGELLGTSPKGSIGRAVATAEGREVASVGRMLFGQFPHPHPELVKERFRMLGEPVPGDTLGGPGA